MVIFSIWWIARNQVKPKWDSDELLRMARHLAFGEDTTDCIEYFNIYSNQRGIVLFLAIIYYLFPTSAIQVIYYLNAIFVFLTVLLIGLIIFELCDSASSAVLTVIMLETFLPLPIYVLLVYGNVPSMFLIALGFYNTVRFIKTDKLSYMILMCFSLIMASFTYTGAMIAELAVLVYLLFVLGARISRNQLIAILVLCLGLLFTGKVATSLYGLAIGQSVDNGMPALAWMYMGISSRTGLTGPGGTDGGHLEMYGHYSNDLSNLSRNIALEVMGVIKEYCSGERSMIFFWEKWKDEWTNSLFDSLRFTQTTNAGDYGLEENYLIFLRGKPFYILRSYLDIFVCMVYMLALFSGVKHLAERKHSHFLLFAVFFVGGFLFQTIWEQAPRYCLIYFVVLIPIAATTLHDISFLPKSEMQSQASQKTF
jgi:hypothetical protein